MNKISVTNLPVQLFAQKSLNTNRVKWKGRRALLWYGQQNTPRPTFTDTAVTFIQAMRPCNTPHSSGKLVRWGLSSIPRYEEKRFVWPCNELLWLCLSHKQHLVPPTVVVNWRRSLCSYSIEQPPTVTQLCTVARLVLCPTIAKCPL